MKPLHIAMALLVAAIWGFNFVVIEVALKNVPPLMLLTLRYIVSALPAIWLARPAMSWGRIALIAATLFLGQVALLFIGMKAGMPAGLASVVVQSQAFFTILFAMMVFRETPDRRQMAGMLGAICGLALVGLSIHGANDHATLAGLLLCLGAAISWAVGNVMLRTAPSNDMLALVSWLSVMVPAPSLVLAIIDMGSTGVVYSLAQLGGIEIAAIVYLGALATTLGFTLWGQLLATYPSVVVVPFALLVPVFGMLSAALFLGERFGPLRIFGAALILASIALVVMPARWWGNLGKP